MTDVLDPAEPMQRTVFETLSAAGVMTDITGAASTVYDSVPAGAAFPYSTIDPFIVIDDSADDYNGDYVEATVSNWSRAVGKVEAAAMNNQVRRALSTELDARAHGVRVVTWKFVDSRILKDPDGVTAHGVVRFRYGVEPLV